LEIQGHSKSSMLKLSKALTSACYYKQYICVHLQLFLR